MCVVNSASSSFSRIHVRPILSLFAIFLPSPPPRFPDNTRKPDEQPTESSRTIIKPSDGGTAYIVKSSIPPGPPVFSSDHLIARHKVL